VHFNSGGFYGLFVCYFLGALTGQGGGQGDPQRAACAPVGVAVWTVDGNWTVYTHQEHGGE